MKLRYQITILPKMNFWVDGSDEENIDMDLPGLSVKKEFNMTVPAITFKKFGRIFGFKLFMQNIPLLNIDIKI